MFMFTTLHFYTLLNVFTFFTPCLQVFIVLSFLSHSKKISPLITNKLNFVLSTEFYFLYSISISVDMSFNPRSYFNYLKKQLILLAIFSRMKTI